MEEYNEVNEITELKPGVHIRYFTIDKNTNEKAFRLGGTLNKIDPEGRFIMLSNGTVTWSVQIPNAIFFQKMTENEYKEELKKQIKIVRYKLFRLVPHTETIGYYLDNMTFLQKRVWNKYFNFSDKIFRGNDKFKFNSFDMDDETIDLSEILSKLKGGKAILIVELNSIWFAGGKFGCTWKLITGKFKCSENNSVKFIVDSDTEKADNSKDEEDDDDEIEELSTSLNNTKVENSEDEYVEDKKEEVVETQVTTEKKKGGRAKK